MPKGIKKGFLTIYRKVWEGTIKYRNHKGVLTRASNYDECRAYAHTQGYKGIRISFDSPLSKG